MSDYIKREDAMDAWYWKERYTDIEGIPNADVVEVVRCKDCQYVCHYDDGHMECRLLADLRPVPCTYLTMKDDDFCSYGEKAFWLRYANATHKI